METRANNALIGLFTLAVIAAALGFVVWFARLADNTKANHYQVVFSGSISGLTVGSSVLFNGIRVGQVDSLDLMPDDPSRVVGRITVKESTPVKVDTRARMEFQGLTGGAYIQLYGGSSNAPPLEPPPDQEFATIYAERSELQNLVDGARDTVTQAAQTLTRIDEFIRKNEGDLTATVGNVRTFTQALASNSGAITGFLQTTGDAAKRIGELADSLNTMSGDLQALIKAVDPAKIDRIVGNVTAASDQLKTFAQAFDAAKAQAAIANVEAFTQALADSKGQITAFATDAAGVAAKLNTMAPKLEAGLDSINKVVGAIDGAKIGRTVDNIDKFAAVIGDNSAEIDGVLKDTRKLSADLAGMTPKLATAFDNINRVVAAIDSAKVDRVLTNVDKVVGAVDSAKVGQAVDNINKFAAVIGDNSAEIDGVLKDTRKLSADLAAMTPKLAATFDSINRVASAIDGPKVDRVLTNVDKFAQTLGDSTQKVQGFINDASDVGRKLNATADRLDVVLKNIETMTSSPEGKGMFAEITETARSIRTLAQNLDSRTQELSKNLNQFSGAGLRDVRELATDGQKTLRDIQRTLNSLQRNPQQLLLGPKSTIPDYKGQ
ncbi:MlaD family protein [Labrys wisconsinensis]|uniref:Phospholipid/cholesterol/gamma-HCH transport system substrate-binding protein n=1 Tax=Labrys wisconsinensis TaxID=425677 RepID=A0ABU0JHF0_9HYPH|nr:MlaD family protein [Labrys wisconsinensis]MDQ0473025.1 phospholipid/cholesterol/gamma-HCH transport system substrate-binding protein [Labrys wisconsinensis]